MGCASSIQIQSNPCSEDSIQSISQLSELYEQETSLNFINIGIEQIQTIKLEQQYYPEILEELDEFIKINGESEIINELPSEISTPRSKKSCLKHTSSASLSQSGGLQKKVSFQLPKEKKKSHFKLKSKKKKRKTIIVYNSPSQNQKQYVSKQL